MSSTTSDRCTTCYGEGETVSEQGPQVCPDCFGDGKPLGQRTKMEWRLRHIESEHRGSGRESEADVLWLVHELRRSREALLCILARCQDADEGDAVALAIKYHANEALGLYSPSST